MVDTAYDIEPQLEDTPDQPGTPAPPQDDEKLRALHEAVSKDYDIGDYDNFKKNLQDSAKRKSFYDAIGKQYDLGTYEEFEKKVVLPPALPEHHITHTSIQDIRHFSELADRPTGGTTLVTGPYYDPNAKIGTPDEVAQNKTYRDKYKSSIADLASTWQTDPEMTQRAIEDFPDESREDKIRAYATLRKDNPVAYGRLKDANDIRMAIAGSVPDGVGDANAWNHLQTAGNFQQLQDNIALQQEIMTKHGLGQAYFEKLKASQSPLINTLDPGLLLDYFNSDYHKAGLSESQYAGLETEKMFHPDKYQQDVAILRHNYGLDEGGGGALTPPEKKGYAYDRGVENVLYQLEQQGRQNTAQYVSQRSQEIAPQIDALTKQYQERINQTPDKAAQMELQQQFQAEPLVQEAYRLEEGRIRVEESRTQDARRFPLNYGDQTTRLVKDALSTSNGWAGVAGKQVLMGAGESADNTLRFIQNTFVNLLGSEQLQAETAAKNIGHQALTELTNYEGSAFSSQQPPLLIGDALVKKVQSTFNDRQLTPEEKNKQATDLILHHQGEITVNPKAGQQGLTWKASIYSAANTIGQILGIADQSLLMGGLLGDASKAQQMANALVPMYASTQNQLYEQALARGDEKPLLRSHLDAAIISLASLINPDMNVVKKMVGAETGIGKMLAGVEESTWNKVLSANKPLVDQMIAGTKAAGRQLGLANLQYGLIVPSAQYIVHKNVFNEDPNLGDAIKDGLMQTSISMALPALLHGVWGGVNAAKVNPMQKYALAEAGLHPKENIELIDQLVEKGQLMPDKADQMKEVIKYADHIRKGDEGVKSDGTPMSEMEIADLTYQLVRKKVLEGKLKNAPDPQKPAIEEKIHEINQSVAELHTSEADKHKMELNQLLTDHLDRIREKMPVMESQLLEAVKRNEPEKFFQEIYDQASQTTKFEGRDVSSRPQVEEIFGKKLVERAFELHNHPVPPEAVAVGERPSTEEKPPEGAATATPEAPASAASSFLQSRHADTIHDEQGIVSGPNNKELSARGRRDAADLAKDLEGKGVTKIVTSGLERSKETGNQVAEKIGAAVEHRPSLDTWNIKDFDGLKDQQFKDVQQWFVENPDSTVYQGPLEEYRGKEVGESVNEYAGRILPEMERLEKESGPETLVINHSNNMMLWDAYLKNGHNWNEQARQDYLAAEKPEPATLTHQNQADAVQERSSAGVLQRPPEGTGSAGGERGGVEPGQQGEAPAGEAGREGEGQEPPSGAGGTPIDPDEWPFREEPFDTPVGIKKVISESVRVQWNLPEVELSPRDKEDVKLRKGKELVDTGKINPREVAARVVDQGQKKGIYTPEEGLAMQYYAYQLRKAEDDLRSDKQEADDLLEKDPGNTAAFYAKLTAEQRLGQLDDEVDLKTKADRINSNSWGDLGDTMQIETDESFSPSRLKATIKDNYGGKIPDEVQKKLDEAIAERDKAIAEMKKAKEKAALDHLEKDAGKTDSTAAKSIREKKEALKKEREDLIEELKKAIKKDTGNLGANPLPIHTVEAISKLALNYFKDGVLTIEGITNKIYEDIKDVVEGIDKEQIREAVASYQPLARAQATEKALRQAASKEVELQRLEARRQTNPETPMELPQKRPPVTFQKDTDYIKAKQRLVNAEWKIKQEKMKSYRSQESRLQKTLGWANRLMRLSILSGVRVLEKLAAAATIGSAAQKPLEEVLNGIWGKAFPKLREKADTDMGMNALAVGRYYSHFFNPVEFARDARDIVKTGETRLGKELESQHFDHIPILDLPTDLHQVIKGPAKRAMFEYALTKILADQQAQNIDINHPLVLESARQRAFARAKYEIFMEDNQVSRLFGKWEAQWREQGKLGAAKSFLLHFAFPVSKVPTNIARRIGLSVAGLPMGLVKVAEAYRKGIDNLSTDEANAIGRSLTKGSIGIALWMAGFFGYKSLGGLYSKFDPNKKRKDEPLADEMKIIGTEVPKPWQHALPFEIMQLGATYRHIYEKTKTDTKSTPIAIAEATMGSAGAILEQIPVVETPVHLISATQDPFEAKKLGEDLKRRIQPQLLQDLGIIKKEGKDKKDAGSRRGGNKP